MDENFNKYIVKDILKIESDSECEKYANEIFKTIYSIGGDYSEKTLREDAYNVRMVDVTAQPCARNKSCAISKVGMQSVYKTKKK